MSRSESKRCGNYKPGPGRPPGRKNNRTLAIEEASRQAVAALGSDAFVGDAHAFLASVYKNPDLPLEIRILAAGKALRVEKPTLSAVHGRMEVAFDLSSRLKAARERARMAVDAPIGAGAIDLLPLNASD